MFNISLGVTGFDGECDSKVIEDEILEAREDEKLALQSIYGNDFEERIPNKTWILNLKLPELVQLLDCKSVKKVEKRTQKQLCPFYLKGFCKFKDRCRYSHSVPSEDDTSQSKHLSHPIYANLKALEDENISPFSVEFRFPEGNKYPHEPPLVVFSSVVDELQPHSRLNISQFLMSLARDAAHDHLPCVFTLVSALEDEEKLSELLSLPPPSVGTPVSVIESVRMANVQAAKSMKSASSGGPDLNLPGPVRQTKEDKESDTATGRDKASYQNFVYRRKELILTQPRPSELMKQNKTLQDEFKKKQAGLLFISPACVLFNCYK